MLVVDDELGVRESLRLVLRDGFEVIPAESGEQALALLATERPDVVLLDILMPGIDGLAVLEAGKHLHLEKAPADAISAKVVKGARYMPKILSDKTARVQRIVRQN